VLAPSWLFFQEEERDEVFKRAFTFSNLPLTFPLSFTLGINKLTIGVSSEREFGDAHLEGAGGRM